MRIMKSTVQLGLLLTGLLSLTSCDPIPGANDSNRFDPRSQAAQVGQGGTETSANFSSYKVPGKVTKSMLQPKNEDYRLGQGDNLTIELTDKPETRQATQVMPDGMVYFDLLPAQPPLTQSALVTWDGVPEFDAWNTAGPNTFQVRLFASGDIVIAYQQVSATDGLVGFSAGDGATFKGATNLSAAGVFGFSFLEENADRVQGLPMEGVQPTYANISSFAYPGARPLYVYVKKAHMRAIPGLEDYMKEWVKSWDKDGPLARIGMVAMPAAAMAANAGKVQNMTVLTRAELEAE